MPSELSNSFTDTGQTLLVIGGFILVAVIVFALSVIAWVFVLRLVFSRWWIAVLVIAAIVALFVTGVTSFPLIYAFFADNWPNPWVIGLAVLIIAGPVGLLFMGMGVGGSHGSLGGCSMCNGHGRYPRCPGCGSVAVMPH